MIISCPLNRESDLIISPGDSSGGYASYAKGARTDNLVLNSTTYQLEYIRDQTYYDDREFCYGHLIADAAHFTTILRSLTNVYNSANVWQVQLLSDRANICASENLTDSDIKFLLVYYTDSDSNAFLDYIDRANQTTKTYQIGSVRAPVSIFP